MDVRLSAAEQAEIWDRYEAGQYIRPIARAIGRSHNAVRDLIAKTGGVRPLVPTEWSDARLSLVEREEISRGIAGGESLRHIAQRLGRAPSTVSREVAANGGRFSYRACDVHTLARLGARRPKTAKLAACPRLRGVLEAKLEKRWSPQQIADWLPRAYPKHPEMRVSHETIYMSLFVQGRGALRQELFRSLRQGRALHCPKGARQPSGKGIINDLVIISERPAEIEDRAVPGHWEGDLISDKGHRLGSRPPAAVWLTTERRVPGHAGPRPARPVDAELPAGLRSRRRLSLVLAADRPGPPSATPRVPCPDRRCTIPRWSARQELPPCTGHRCTFLLQLAIAWSCHRRRSPWRPEESTLPASPGSERHSAPPSSYPKRGSKSPQDDPPTVSQVLGSGC